MDLDGHGHESQESLFFHQQRNPVRHYRRVRKEPEELPQALRYFKYANLNPRIAAYLGKQDPKSILKRVKNQGAKPDGKEVGGTAPSAGVGGNEFDNSLGREVRGLLPEIEQGINLFGNTDFDSTRFPFFGEYEDPQRYQFEETTFAAPNILRELSDALNRFVTSFKSYVDRTTLYNPDTGEPLSTDAIRPAVLIPAGVKELLNQSWSDLTSDVVQAPRMWQSFQTRNSLKHSSPEPKVENIVNTKASVSNEKRGMSGGMKSIADLLEEVQNKSRNRKDGDAADAKAFFENKRKGRGKEPTHLSSFGTGKLKELSTKSSLNVNQDEIQLPGAGREEVTKVYRYGGCPTISFNLSSRRAADEGWIVNQQPEPDIGSKNLLEWATKRLQMAIKEKENEEAEAEKIGSTKPVLIRYYGDSRRDTLLKLYRKGNENDNKSNVSIGNLIPGKRSGNVPKIPQLTKLDSGQKEMFLIQLPDGSTSIFYPKTNQTAIVASAVPGEPGQLYIHCFNNDANHTALASFTPYGKSCCYHTNGDPGLILSEEGGVIKSESGIIQQKWKWFQNDQKLKEPIDFQLNKEMYVRIVSKSTVHLFFTCNRESFKISVGALPGVTAPQSSTKVSSIMLQSSYSASLRSAIDFALHNKPQDMKGKQSKPKRMKKLFTSQQKKIPDIEALRQGVDPPERFEFDSQSDRELLRLEGKTKHLVDEWMEHYRMAIGISSYSLKRMLDKPKVTSSTRDIRSARERAIQYEEEEFVDNKSFQSFRCPSAPPRHMMPGPHSLTVEDKRVKKKRSHQEKKVSETAHVRIELPPSTTISDPVATIPSRDAQYQHLYGSEVKSRPSTQLHRSTSRPRVQDTRKANSANMALSDAGSSTRKFTLLCDGCPVVARYKLLLTDKKEIPRVAQCKCSKHKIPFINDLEFDYFFHRVAPTMQLVVIYIINSNHPTTTPYERMLDHIYIVKNKNRTQPCKQAKSDQYRILFYDLAIAKLGTKRSAPLLLTRHNVVPGMTLMYCGGRLLFADHIFNGYGNAKNDFRKQILLSRHAYALGHFLPDDFRFSPEHGKSGPRAAWGGEVGGVVHRGSEQGSASSQEKYSNKIGDGASTSASSEIKSFQIPISRSFGSSRDFVQFSLSTQFYAGQPSNKTIHSHIATTQSAFGIEYSRSSPIYLSQDNSPHSAMGLVRPMRNRGTSGYLRMQTVK